MKDRIIITTIVVALAALVAVGVLGSDDSSGSDRDVEAYFAGYTYSSADKINYTGNDYYYLFYDGTKEEGDKLFARYLETGNTSGFESNPTWYEPYYVYYKYIDTYKSVGYNGKSLDASKYNEDQRIYLSAGAHEIELKNWSGSNVYLRPNLEFRSDSEADAINIYDSTYVNLAVGGYYYVMTYMDLQISTKVTLNITNYSEVSEQKKDNVSGTAELDPDGTYKIYAEYGTDLKITTKVTDSDHLVYLKVDDREYLLEDLTEYTYEPDKTGYVYLNLVSKSTGDPVSGTIGLDVSGSADNDDNAVVPAVICLVLFALTIAIVVISMQKPKWSLGKTE